MQEVAIAQGSGNFLVAWLRTAFQGRWVFPLVQRLAASLWIGGWSFLRLPLWLYGLHGLLLVAGGVGWVFLWRRPKQQRPWLLKDAGMVLVLAALMLCTGLGLAFHAVSSQLVWGKVHTNPWYGMVAFPWLLVLFGQGLMGYPWRSLRLGLFWSLATVFVLAELAGAWLVMVPAYTATANGALALQRLAKLHLAFPGPSWLLPTGVASLGLSVLLGWASARAWVEAERA
jgi:hypothetical protein